MGPEAPLEWMRHSPQGAARPHRQVHSKRGALATSSLGTDLGQSGNPTPADGLQMFVAGLQAEGISREEIDTMGREVPGALLMG